jgi:hypothetical protein
MVGHAMYVLSFFLCFDVARFNVKKTNNMLATMLNLQFKGLKCLIEYTECHVANKIFSKYDIHVLVPLIMKATKILNHNVVVMP